MRTHSLNQNIAIPDSLHDLKMGHRHDGRQCLTDESRTYTGAIYQSPSLSALAASFDYAAHGYDRLTASQYERAPIADYINGKLQPIQQASFDFSYADLTIGKLDKDLRPFEDIWQNLFERFAAEVEPMMGKSFEIRLKFLKFSREDYHYDSHSIALLPLGQGRSATLCKSENGNIIRPPNGSLVTTTPLLKHSGPVSGLPRAGLGASKMDYHY